MSEEAGHAGGPVLGSARLDGILLSANERISDAGGMSFFHVLGVYAICCFCVANEITLGGVELARYNHWHTYVLLFVLLACVAITIVALLEKRAYASIRRDISTELEALRATKYELVSALETRDKDGYGDIRDHLKKDKDR